MNLFSAVKDMGSMLTAAPDLFESANQLAENAQAQAAAVPSAAALEPIAGVSLDLYVAASRSTASFAYDPAQLPAVVSQHGVTAEQWAQAQVGWAQRIQSDPAVGATFNRMYTAV